MPGDLGTSWNVSNYIFLVEDIWIINVHNQYQIQ